MKNTSIPAEEINAMPAVFMTPKQFAKHAARFGQKVDPAILRKKFKQGHFLGVWQKENGDRVALYLQLLLIRRMDMIYGTSKGKDGKPRRARELIIASSPIAAAEGL